MAGHRAQGTWHMAHGTWHRAQGTGHRAQGTGHRAQGAGRRAQGAGRRAQGTGRRAQGIRSEVAGGLREHFELFQAVIIGDLCQPGVGGKLAAQSQVETRGALVTSLWL
jgi:hypothetical protein